MALITPDRLKEEKRRHERTTPEGPHHLPYGVSGWRWADEVALLRGANHWDTILDYGAGKGTLSQVLDNVTNYDPVTFPDEPEPADIVVVTDVLEHVEDLDAVLAHIKSLARKAVFIAVPKHPEEKANPALRIESLSWWETRLAEYWPDYTTEVVESWQDGVRKWRNGRTPRLKFVGRC